ncbi:MAG TPA: glycosyltransferase family 4 protein [Gemmatimonadales bacterium]|nr:glycosyltransferase family 4 protein [Gemmatimonadales bacterium]
MVRTVVHFDDSREFGGAQKVLLHLMAGLDRRQWRPVLFHHPAPGIVPMVEAARLLDIERREVPPIWTRSEAWTGFGPFVQQLRDVRPAVFHAHLTTAIGCKYGVLAAALLRVPAIVATLQLVFDVLPAWRYDVSQRLITTCVDRYIAVSKGIAGRLRERFHVPDRKIHVIYNAVPLPGLDRADAAGLRGDFVRSDGCAVVLTLARLEEQKGLGYLLDAAARVPNARFVIAGEGRERASLEQRAAALGLGNRVVFVGFRADTAALLRKCDLFVLPSLFEGLPLSILEAMAARKPVIASCIAGNDEAVVHGETGLLVPPADGGALAEAIQRLLADPGLAHRLAAAGHERVRREFSTDAMVSRVSALYDEVLTRQGRPNGAGV